MLGNKKNTIRLVLIAILLTLMSACSPSAPEPPPTLQAVFNGTAVLADMDLENVSVLQERPYGTGQLMLYSWSDNNGDRCLAATYLTTVSGRWQVHDTASAPCAQISDFNAAYTGNSQIEAPFGLPRHTAVYGTSRLGHAVRIVWSDGQVNHVPINNASFLEVRDGRWEVERIELLDENNNFLLIEEFSEESQFSTN